MSENDKYESRCPMLRTSMTAVPVTLFHLLVHGRLLTAFLFLFAVAGAQTQTLADFPRDAKGRLQPFDCGRLSPPHKPHKCDPVEFSNVLKRTKTVAVIAAPSLHVDDLGALRKHAETLIRSWRHFRVVDDPEGADLIFQLLPFSAPTGSLGERFSDAQILVWPRGRNPQRDDVVWAETYFAKLPKSDAFAAVIKLLRRDIEDCEKLSSR